MQVTVDDYLRAQQLVSLTYLSNVSISAMAARPKASELIGTVSRAFCAYAEDPEDENLQGIINLFVNPPNDLIFLRIKTEVVSEHSKEAWNIMRDQVLRQLDQNQQAEGSEEVEEDVRTSIFQWLTSLQNDRKRALAMESKSRPTGSSIASLAKFQLQLKKFSGAKGEARRWWKGVKETLESMAPDPSPALKQTFFPLIQKALEGYENGQTLLGQLKKKFTADGLADLDSVMDKFVDHHDRHSLDILFIRWKNLKQRRSESIDEFQVRFQDLREDLAAQDFCIPEFNAWVKFRNSVLRSPKLREKQEIKSIVEAVDFLSNNESSNIKITADGDERLITQGPSLNLAQMNTHSSDGLNRCGNCQRPSIAHRGKCGLGRRCTFPRNSLQAQLTWERRNNFDPQTGRKRRDDNHQGSSSLTSKAQRNKKKRKKSLINRANRIAAQMIAEVKSQPNAAASASVITQDANSNQASVASRAEQIRRVLNAPITMFSLTGDCRNQEWFERDRKITMTHLKVIQSDINPLSVPALFDTGALPLSYVSSKWITCHGMQSLIVKRREEHGTAHETSRFRSIGEVILQILLPNGFRFKHPFKVADVSTELIIGRDLCKKLGVVINFVDDSMTCVNAENCSLPMIPMSDWRSVSKITSLDFEGTCPMPRDFSAKFPGLNLRQIAEELEKTKDEDDLSIERGKAIVDDLLKTEFKEVTIPRSRPSDKITPAPIPFKPEFENCIVNVPIRKHSPDDWEKIEETTEAWLDSGKVEPSKSAFNTPHVVAKKATPPYYRIALDFRRLNRMVDAHKFPVRPIREQAEEMSNKKIFSTMDEDQAYTQVPIFEPHRPRTAFSTRRGKYQFVTFPYGLVISGDVFNGKKMEIICDDGGDALLWHFLWFVVDDDALATNKVITHVFVILCLLIRFKKFGLTLRLPKCRFFMTRFKWGGYIISHGKIEANPSKGMVISKLPVPTNMRELKRFLGMCTWHLKDFESTFAHHSSALTSAFRKPNDKKSFAAVWKEKRLDKPFNELKRLAAQELVNTTFSPHANKTQLWFDWSKQAISSVLMQDSKIVRVSGRSCSTTESNYFPTKGEFLAYDHAQMSFRNELLALQQFDALTDHRPLIGLDKKLDLNKLDPMFTVWRERTEQFRSRRNLIYVHGDSNHSDLWTRMFPWSVVNNQMNVDALLLTVEISADDFLIDDQDESDIATMRKNGLRLDQSDGRLRVWHRKQWRDYIPVRTRLVFLKMMHGPKHVGERSLMCSLSAYCFPKKQAFVKEFLRSCQCSSSKSDGNPRNESKSSAARTAITAENDFDIVQIDVFDFKNVHYLTAVDVKSGKAFVQKICRIGRFKSGSMGYTTALFSAYSIMESMFPKIPNMLRCDNEVALKRIPHPNVVAGPIHHPQSQGKVERLHKELSKLCRIYDCLPDVAINHFNAQEPSGGGVLIVDDSVRPCISATEWKDYVGRKLDVGDLVWKRRPSRSRRKEDDFWHELSRVTERVGAKSYHVYDGTRITLCHIDNLKSFSLGEELIRRSKINPMFVARAEADAFGSLEIFDTVCKDFELFDPDAHDSDVVWIGYPGRDQLEIVAHFIAEREFRIAFLIAPDLRCERWYSIIDSMEDAKWFGAKPKEELKFWVDSNDRAIIEPGVIWWLIKFRG